MTSAGGGGVLATTGSLFLVGSSPLCKAVEFLHQDIRSVTLSNLFVDRQDQVVSDGAGEGDLTDDGGQSSGDSVLNSFGDPNSHFTELLGGHVEGGVWRRQPEALQDFWNHLHHHLPWAELFGATGLLLLLCQAPSIHLCLAEDLGMSAG